ncbi:MAG: hypothetical protein LBH43_14225 [Treponema sp.]|nr:hypothetical protein [Treponema sp.]
MVIPLREYPVTSVLPDCGTDIDIQFTMPLSPTLQRYRNLSAVKVVYWTGYSSKKAPADLASACLELASWNMNRYRGRQVGMTGNIRGLAKKGSILRCRYRKM